MDSLTINRYVSMFQKRNIFKGVFPCDRLPRKFNLPAAFIINLSTHYEPGSHWVGLYINENGHAYYFDSFGIDVKNFFIRTFIRLHSKKLTINRKQLQHISSIKCGKFCCVFVSFILKNCPISEFLKKCSLNLFVNDITIENMYNYLNKMK